VSVGLTAWGGFVDEFTKIAVLRKALSAGASLAKSGWRPQAGQASDMRKKVQALLAGNR